MAARGGAGQSQRLADFHRRFKAIDHLRRAKRETPLEEATHPVGTVSDSSEPSIEHFSDDRLRLIFICCHPEIPA